MIYQKSLTDIKPIWDTAYGHNPIHAPFVTWTWHNVWRETLGKTTDPLYLVIDDTVVAPFVKNGNVAIWSGGDEISDYQDLIGQDTHKSSAWEKLLPYLRDHGVSELILRNIPENSSTLTFFQKLPHTTVEKEDTTPRLILPDSWDIYKDSLDRKYRHELERKIRKFQREHIDGTIIESSDPKGDIRFLFDLMMKDDAKKLFLTSEMQIFFTTMVETFASHVSLLFVTLGDKKIASTLSFVEDGTYFLYNSGFDKACCANAGFYLKAMTLERAIKSELKEYNFLQGNERYKYELGGIDFGVYKITCQI